MKLKDELPQDHRLAQVYRFGAAGCGVILVAFGCLGFADRLAFFDTRGVSVAGMSSNGLLSLISVLVGLLLVGAAFVGGNFASTANMVVGVLFLIAGFAHLFVLDRSANILNFRMSNVLFSFVMGLMIMTFGMYGRVSGGLPHDNPYWRSRHPREAAAEDARRARAALAARGLAPAGPTSADALVRGGAVQLPSAEGQQG
ncbi:hypothetical protein GCM10010329_79460 [Streptomyces spiroverticillatus]|uniref:DUF4383 domain-containing protein n=1 Tax=Streptomyces finlayi TaxID=67296 RepID=A0A918X8Z8_9ACTN|nr:DUF4383 domain-containing protein [Streptomyces finlayi]GHA44851.1 hypothetical protein GCM10010329_79460 [Streptomyces spiroverticillatus]GHD18048.1 hypothetical protein GCM10010334_80440 [Streptomyces finlayi]